jgi:hypothetical protein
LIENLKVKYRARLVKVAEALRILRPDNKFYQIERVNVIPHLRVFFQSENREKKEWKCNGGRARKYIGHRSHQLFCTKMAPRFQLVRLSRRAVSSAPTACNKHV